MFFFFKQKTAYEMRISDWSSDVCSSDLGSEQGPRAAHKLIRESQVNALFVVDRHRALVGVVHENDVADAVREGRTDLQGLVDTNPVTVSADTFCADLFADSAQTPVPLAVQLGRASCRERVCQYV